MISTFTPLKTRQPPNEPGQPRLQCTVGPEKQMYTGHADWNILKEVASQLTIPFMANGDIRTPEDAKKMLI